MHPDVSPHPRITAAVLGWSAPGLKAAEPAARTLRSLRVLLTDDNAINRQVIKLFLAPQGCEITEATNGKEALELVAKCNGRIDLVFTDVVMPQMGGPEMVENLLEMRPGIKVIYTSGFTESTIVERGVALGKVRLIQKPFTRELLAQRIRRTLDEG